MTNLFNKLKCSTGKRIWKIGNKLKTVCILVNIRCFTSYVFVRTHHIGICLILRRKILIANRKKLNRTVDQNMSGTAKSDEEESYELTKQSVGK
jgi:hypothetical protein